MWRKDFFIANKILNLILPPRCVVTGEEVEEQGMLSPKAWADLTFISEPYCSCCGVPFSFDLEATELSDGNTDSTSYCANCLSDPPFFDKARSCILYDDGSRPLILGFKHGDQTHAVRAFLPWLKKAGVELLEHADVIMPVPLHPFRLLRRRYNQAAIIAVALSKAFNIPVDVETLCRKRATPVQGHLSKKDRIRNVDGAFVVEPRKIDAVQGKTILLIDDVLTTGATVNECARVLSKAGAKKTYVLTLARVASF